MPSATRQRTLDLLFLAATTALGAWLRLRLLAAPSLWLDEIIDYDVVTMIAHQPLWRWFDIFEGEHGPLFYATELAGRVLPGPELSSRIAPALLGIAAIPLAWFAARAVTSFRGAPYAFAILIAVSPLDVYYSRDARPYALVVLITLGFVALLLRENRIQLLIVLFIASFYSTATIAAVIGGVVIAAAIRKRWRIAAGAIVCGLLIAICYRPSVDLGHQRFPAPDALLQAFTMTALDDRTHRAAYLFLALAIAGAVALWIHNRIQAAVVIAMTIVPLAIPIAASWWMQHFFNVRYVIGALPGFLLLVAIGIAAIVRYRIAAIVAAALLVQPGWDAATTESFHKLDWRGIAQTIALHAHENDVVIASNRWTFVSLHFYLRDLKPHVHLYNAEESPRPGRWLVVAGGFGSNFPEWACRFPVVLASPIEDFRLHYASTPYGFLTERSTRGEQRALAAASAGPPSIRFGPGDDALLGGGWSDAEPDEGRWARWAIGKQSFLALPSIDSRQSAIAIDVAPVSVLKQTMNGIALAPGRHRYSFPVDLKPGVNVLRLDWGASVAPADLDPRSSDHRPLAARVYAIDAGGKAAEHIVRLDAPDIGWHEHDGRTLPPNVDRAKLAALLGRMGLDPERFVPDLMSGRTTLANLAMTIADDSVCIDDPQFVRELVGALLDREAAARDFQLFGAEMRSGASRRTIAWRLGNSDEVRSRLRE